MTWFLLAWRGKYCVVQSWGRKLWQDNCCKGTIDKHVATGFFVSIFLMIDLCKFGSNTFNSALVNTIKAMLEGQYPHTTTDKVLSTEPLVPLNEAKQKLSVVTKGTVREYGTQLRCVHLLRPEAGWCQKLPVPNMGWSASKEKQDSITLFFCLWVKIGRTLFGICPTVVTHYLSTRTGLLGNHWNMFSSERLSV